MNSETVQYKRTLRGSVGAGMGSLFNGSGRSFFILEHKNTSTYHRAGESQKIIVDQVEIGRDSTCQVQFDESFQTVSRKHAAIVREGNRWKLVQLSKTNCTLLNGRPVDTEWYLENGDEIQLSVGGPRLGFIIPAGKQSLVSSIKMTERLELFRKQALAPYKTAIACLSVVLLLSVGGLGYGLYSSKRSLVDTKNELAEVGRRALALQDSLAFMDKEHNDEVLELNKKLADLTVKLSKERKSSTDDINVSGNYLNQIRNSVYFIYVKRVTVIDHLGVRFVASVDEPDDCPEGLECLFCCGTGFMLEDGTFVTAKHVVQPHLFAKNENEDLAAINQIVALGGSVEFLYAAVSPSDSFEFTDRQVVCNMSCERTIIKRKGTEHETKYRVSPSDGNDWAYVKTSRKGTISADIAMSKEMKSGTRLAILGYPGGQSGDNVQSVLGSCMVAVDGISKEDRVIWTTERNFEHGNSGGPAFITLKDGTMKAIGIVTAGSGETLGFLVPLANLNIF